MADDDFQLVTHSRKKKWSKKKKNKNITSQREVDKEDQMFDAEKCVIQIQNIRY